MFFDNRAHFELSLFNRTCFTSRNPFHTQPARSGPHLVFSTLNIVFVSAHSRELPNTEPSAGLAARFLLSR